MKRSESEGGSGWSAPVLGRSNVRTGKPLILPPHPLHHHIAAPGDGRTPEISAFTCRLSKFLFQSSGLFRVENRIAPCLNEFVDDEPIQLPIDGVLDLHTFQPREVKSLVMEYLAECRSRGILRVRIIHGKGIGQLRQTVHAILEKHPSVTSFNLAGEHFGGWGATIVFLKPDGGELEHSKPG